MYKKRKRLNIFQTQFYDFIIEIKIIQDIVRTGQKGSFERPDRTDPMVLT